MVHTATQPSKSQLLRKGQGPETTLMGQLAAHTCVATLQGLQAEARRWQSSPALEPVTSAVFGADGAGAV